MTPIPVSFTDVGARKRSWKDTLADKDETLLLKSIKKFGGLNSRDVEVSIDEEKREGAIFVGVFRCVGKFTWEETK